MELVPIDHDPFGDAPSAQGAQVPALIPVGHDPFKGAEAPPQPKPKYSGALLPFSVDAQGKASFDSKAGILGILRGLVSGAQDAATLPRDVYQGKVDPLSDEGIVRAMGLATLATPLNPAARIGDRAIPGVANALQKAKVEPPTAEALRQTAGRGYDAVRDMGVDYQSDAVAGMARAARANLEKDGILGELAPKTSAILGKLEAAPAGSVAPISGLEAARRAFGHAKRDFQNPTDQLAAGRVTDELDAFIQAADPASVVAGPAAAAARELSAARGNYAAAKRSDQLTGIDEAASLRASSTHSGQNGDNALRQRIVSMLLKPKERAGFTEAELKGLEETVKGTPLRNSLRTAGNLLGGGGGLGSMVAGSVGGAAGGLFGGPVGVALGAAIPAFGFGARRLGNAMTERSLAGVDKMTRMRSPLYEQMLAEAPMEVMRPVQREMLLKGLLQTRAYDPK